jgi:hypothetical protein
MSQSVGDQRPSIRPLSPQKMNAFLGVQVANCREVARKSGDHIEVLEYHIKRDDFTKLKFRVFKILSLRHQKMFEEFEKQGGEAITL